MAGLIDKINSQNFGENDSQIVSTVRHPVKAGKQFIDWLESTLNTALGAEQQPTDEGDIYAKAPLDLARLMASAEIAGLAETGSIPFAPKSAGGLLGTFIGPKAKNWNKAAEAKARKMLAEGVDPEQVWKETMIGVMPDNLFPDFIPENSLFSEIADNTASYKSLGFGGTSPGYADEAFKHPELFKEYPELKNVAIQEMPGINGSFDFSTNKMELGIDGGSTDDLAAHEFQHAIQTIEEWPSGGNSESAGSFDAYRKLAGEAQARATQDRMMMDLLERRQNYPLKGDKLSDVNLNDLIYKYGGLINSIK